jgi:hypothetical protein
MTLTQKLFRVAKIIESREQVLRLSMPYVGDRNAATKAKAKLDEFVSFTFGEFDHTTYMGSIVTYSVGKEPGLISMPVGFRVGSEARKAMQELKRNPDTKKLGIKANWGEF